jgi:molybdopterin-guanine dinucleotide biosynthesis protein A
MRQVEPVEAAVVLCGGRATRMGGGDKPLRMLAGRPILAYVLERLEQQAARIAINAPHTEAYGAFGRPLVADAIVGQPGPLAGVHAAMLWAAQVVGAPAVMTVAGDTPFLPRDLARRLYDAAGDGRIAVATAEGERHPVFAVWPVALADALAAFLASGEKARVNSFIDRHPHVDVDFGAPAGLPPFYNINTPDDLEAAEAMVARQ